MTLDRPNLDEALQRALNPAPAPTDLRSALLREARRRDRPASRRWWAGLAALLILGLGFWWKALGPGALTGPKLAQATLSEFVQGHTLDFQGPPPTQPPCPDPCRIWSKAVMGFEAPLPQEAAACPLQGGRVCRVRGQRAACYLLKDGRCVFVFEKPIPKVGDGGVLAVAAGFQARAWNEGMGGVVMVEPNKP